MLQQNRGLNHEGGRHELQETGIFSWEDKGNSWDDSKEKSQVTVCGRPRPAQVEGEWISPEGQSPGGKMAVLDPGMIKFMKYCTERFVKIMGQISKMYKQKL